MSIKKRLALGAGAVATVGAVATLVAGVTFGLFSSTITNGASTFTAGTVTLSNVASTTCTVGNVNPGDSTSGYTASMGNNSTGSTCTLQYSYSGTSYAWLALDVTYTQTAGSPQVPYTQTTAPTAADLIDGSANGLQLLVKDSAGSGTTLITGHQYTNDANPNALANLPTGNSGVNDILLNTSSTSTKSQGGTISLDWFLPNDGVASNAYQAATTTVTLTVHAVQTDNDPTAGNTSQTAPVTVGNSCIIKAACVGGEIPNWS